jgi:hypothetical protein
MTDAAGGSGLQSRMLSYVTVVIALVGNLIPLFGVLYWGWDTFQLLMLYWMETVIVAVFTLRRLARLNEGERGTITVNGVEKPATPFSLVSFFSMHAGIFILVHFIFLWALFSWQWFKKVHGIDSFFYELFIANGIWVALLLFFAASWVSFRIDSKPAYTGRVERKVYPNKVAEWQAKHSADFAVGPIVGMLYARIVIMQVAIIAGALLAEWAGSIAPLVIVIVLKTLLDIALGALVPVFKGMTFSTGNESVET